MKNLGREQYLAVVDNYKEIEDIVRSYQLNPDALEWLYDNSIITKQEFLSAGKNKQVANKILSDLDLLLRKFCSGCSLCMRNCACDNVRLMAAKRRVSVDEQKWMNVNGAGGGSLPYPSNLEIPEICAKGMCGSLGWTMRDFKREMQ